MKREIILTADGSTTIQIVDWDEQYHSIHGAVNEAYHVFVRTGLHYYLQQTASKKIKILEMGFGTGLNAFITALEADDKSLQILYEGVEAYPVKIEEAQAMNYATQIDKTKNALFTRLHSSVWETTQEISDTMRLLKRKLNFLDIRADEAYDLIYFDAFGPRVQPELWTVNMFKSMFNALTPNGVLVTYSAKGSVRRAMQEVGFTVERLPGPPGKREMLRASKLL
ncbi:tRNA (5-methylaminomethyl-2-thiouridine)(34)-methyltransferase MnmD [Aquimarina sp. W85]|uniref:tRNA (5-methylaminomethyl-2-thiouridine)(34)-methyltransferase MnmD n=1 Tax=Aquimarina rhodophyticola TaxID=3342246 RepID=UPI00366E5903